MFTRLAAGFKMTSLAAYTNDTKAEVLETLNIRKSAQDTQLALF